MIQHYALSSYALISCTPTSFPFEVFVATKVSSALGATLLNVAMFAVLYRIQRPKAEPATRLTWDPPEATKYTYALWR